jgi:hypothetical protein
LIVCRLSDLGNVTEAARKAILLTLYVHGFHDELFALLEAGQAGTEKPNVLGFLLNLMVQNKDVASAFSVASIVFGQQESPITEVLSAFKPLVKEIIDKNLAAGIFDQLAALPTKSKAAVEEVMRSAQDSQCYILFLIYTGRLAEAAELYKKRKDKVPMIEFLLVGRNNSMPASYKFLTQDRSLAGLHYPDAQLCNRVPSSN